MGKRVISLIVGIMMVFTGAGVTYSPGDEENIKLSFVASADTHMESNNSERCLDLIDALKDMGGASHKNDAMVICGDVTMNGQLIEYLCLCAVLGVFDKADNTLIAMGNHEVFTDRQVRYKFIIPLQNCLTTTRTLYELIKSIKME